MKAPPVGSTLELQDPDKNVMGEDMCRDGMCGEELGMDATGGKASEEEVTLCAREYISSSIVA